MMVDAVCIKKIRDSRGTIKSYILRDRNGTCIERSSADLKRDMANNFINVLNLKIDKAGRLIDMDLSKNPQFSHYKNSDPEANDSRLIKECLPKVSDFFSNSERSITACRLGYDEFSVTFPDRVETIIERNIHTDDFREKLFMEITKNKEYAYICYGYETLSDGIVGSMVVTRGYGGVKKFLQEQVEEQAENEGITFKEALDHMQIGKCNELAKIYISNFIAESSWSDLLMLKIEVLHKVKEFMRWAQQKKTEYTLEESVLKILTGGERSYNNISFIYRSAVACKKDKFCVDLEDFYNYETIKDEARKLTKFYNELDDEIKKIL